MIQPGEIAPDFTLSSDAHGDVTLSALRGKPVVLYFYPKDDTPACTQEACDFRDSMARVQPRPWSIAAAMRGLPMPRP